MINLDKVYKIAGREFKLKFPNYAVREEVREIEGFDVSWYLYRDSTLLMLPKILHGDFDGLTKDSITDADEPVIQEVRKDFSKLLKEVMEKFGVSLKR